MKPTTIRVGESLLERLRALPDTREGGKKKVLTPEQEKLLLEFWPKKSQHAIAQEFGICTAVLREHYRRLTKAG